MNPVFIHSTALVETGRIGEGTRIWAFTHVMPEVSIGANCNIGDHCFIESGVTVTRNVPRHALVIGAPARLRGWVCQCGLPLILSEATARCAECEFVFTNFDAPVEVVPTAVSEAFHRTPARTAVDSARD